MENPLSIQIHNRQRFEQNQPGEWLKLPTTAEQLHAAMLTIGITDENRQNFFINGIDSQIETVARFSLQKVQVAGIDEMNYLAARLEQFDTAEIEKLNAVFQSLQVIYGEHDEWDAVDFKNDTITIRHTVTSCNLDGKHIIIASDTTKTKSSMRTLPLVPAFKEKLLTVRAEREENRRLCGRSYNKEYLDYVCVNEMGELMKPAYITATFPTLLERNGLRKIRFHDLRHSCASLLLANGVPMKQIQDWLGHSDFSTTANIYAHLDYNSKLSSAKALETGLKL